MREFVFRCQWSFFVFLYQYTDYKHYFGCVDTSISISQIFDCYQEHNKSVKSPCVSKFLYTKRWLAVLAWYNNTVGCNKIQNVAIIISIKYINKEYCLEIYPNFTGNENYLMNFSPRSFLLSFLWCGIFEFHWPRHENLMPRFFYMQN